MLDRSWDSWEIVGRAVFYTPKVRIFDIYDLLPGPMKILT
jgi:hypothetical protein